MEPEGKEKIRLTVKEILLTFCDGMAKIEEIFGYSWQRKEAREYWKWRDSDKDHLRRALWRLEKQGYLKKYQKEKKNLIKLTPLGEKRALQYLADEFKTTLPKTWNKKWHLVIFDIPKDKKSLGDVVRERLKRWGFYQLQKSVFVYPFDCRKQIAALKYIYSLGPYVQYIIADAIETELNLVDHFYEQDVLTKEMLGKKK